MLKHEEWTAPGCDTNACVEAQLRMLPPPGTGWSTPNCETGACVEVSDTYPTPATMKGNVEVRQVDEYIEMRNSTEPNIIARFTMEEWDAFVANANKFVAA